MTTSGEVSFQTGHKSETGPNHSKLYIVGDSIFDSGRINTLTFGTPIGDYNGHRTNTQDVDGDGVEDGEPYAATRDPVWHGRQGPE